MAIIGMGLFFLCYFCCKILFSMDIKVGDFFIPNNSVSAIATEDYRQFSVLVDAAKAFARSTYQSVYIIDYYKKGFLYASDSLAYLCGEPVEKLRDFGYNMYLDHVPVNELKMLLEINNKGFQLFETLPMCERTEYTISYDFHITNGKKKNLINHKLTPIVLTQDGKIWLALCTMSMSSYNTPGHVVMKKSGGKSFFQYDLDAHKWKAVDEVKLTDVEKEVLKYSAQGYTMNEIADKMCKSVDTIKSCKRLLFARLEVIIAKNSSVIRPMAINGYEGRPARGRGGRVPPPFR